MPMQVLAALPSEAVVTGNQRGLSIVSQCDLDHSAKG
jgi:hypothetical protein